MPVHHRVTPRIKFTGTNLYTCVERGTERVKRLAQEHNTMSPARARTRTARSGVQRTDHWATLRFQESVKFSADLCSCLSLSMFYFAKHSPLSREGRRRDCTMVYTGRLRPRSKYKNNRFLYPFIYLNLQYPTLL